MPRITATKSRWLKSGPRVDDMCIRLDARSRYLQSDTGKVQSEKRMKNI